ncbi:MAG: tail fiber domain-containing protein, partial [Candidatus Levybacteria bacterium]|nr:tail fiber domain-containing protein [Candidatus Levybacteria bacterium]
TLTQTGAFDALLVQDASGDTSPFVVDQSGNVGIQTTSPTAGAGLDVAAGDIFVASGEGLDTRTASGTLLVGNTNATTLTAGAAATTANFAAAGSLTRTINIGTGTGVDTIHIGDGATGADVITIGSANAGAVSVTSNAALSLTGSTNSLINFPNFDVSTAGNVTVAANEGIDTNAAGTLEVGEVTATTVSIGGTAATTLNLGAGGSLTRTINIGTGTGVDTIHIGDGATGADVITIGSANAGAVTVRSNAALSLIGSTNSTIDFPNFDVSTAGDITTLAGGDILGANSAAIDIGEATSGDVEITGDLLPAADATYDLGSTTKSWRNAYLTGSLCFDDTDCISASGGYWLRNLGAVSPTNVTDDLLLGAAATTSAIVKFPGLTNNNAFFNLGTGNVGIGTTTPLAKFDVRGTGISSPVASISGQTNAVAALVVDNKVGDLFTASSSGLNRFVIKQNGNVGIGTILPGQKLDVAGNISSTAQIFASQGTNSAPSFADRASNNTGINFRGTGVSIDATIGGTAYFSLNSNGFQLKSGTAFGFSSGDPTLVAPDINFSRGAAGKMYVGNGTVGDFTGTLIAGNIGIGTTSPTTKLDVAGNASIQGYATASASLTIGYTSVPGGTGNAVFSGNVGIGTTNPSLARLQIGITGGADSIAANKFVDLDGVTFGDYFFDPAAAYGSASIAASIVFQKATATTHSIDILNGNAFAIRTSPGGEGSSGSLMNERLRVTGIGTIGIGTTSPLATLDLRGVLGTVPVASISGQTSFAALLADNKGNGDIFTASSSGLNRFVIRQNGNVGIGTTLPAAYLDVNGSGGVFGSNAKAILRLANTDSTATNNAVQMLFSANRTGGIQTPIASISGILTDNGATSYLGALAFSTASKSAVPVERLRIDGLGNVGIGSTSPIASVDVNTRASKVYYSNSTNYQTTTSSTSQSFGVYQTTNLKDRLAIVTITTNSSTITSVTFGGTAMTQLQTGTEAANRETYFFYLANPPSGNQTVAITLGTSSGIAASTHIFGNVNQLSPIGNSARDTSGVLSSSITCDTPNDMVFDTVGWTGGLRPDPTAAGQTIVASASASTTHNNMSSKTECSTSPTVPAWQFAAGNNTTQIAAEINAVPGTNNANPFPAFAIDNNGNVGIGTNVPTEQLEFVGANAKFSGPAGGGGLTIKSQASVAGNGAELPGTDAGTILEGAPNYHLVFDLRNNGGSDTIAMRYSSSNNTIVDKVGFALRGDGNVGIGTVTPENKLDVQGDVRLGINNIGCVEDDNGTLLAGACSSDVRLKKDIQSIGGVLNRFENLRAVSYKWRADEFPDRHFGDATSYGFIAQEVQQLFPELVVEDGSGYLRLNYTALNIYTAAATHELAIKTKSHELSLNGLINNLQIASPSDLIISQNLGDYSIAKNGQQLSNNAGFAFAGFAKLIAGLTTTRELVVNGTATFLGNVQIQALNVVTGIQTQTLSVLGAIHAGSINASIIAVSNLSIAGQSLRDYILSVIQNSEFVIQNESGITSPVANIDRINTNIISPLAGDEVEVKSNISIKKNNGEGGNLSVEGNASISGTLAGTNASFSGTLTADRIIANQIEGLEATIGTLSAKTIINNYNIYQTASESAATSDVASNSALASSGSGTFVTGDGYSLITSNLYSGAANISSLSADLAYVPNFSAETATINQGLMVFGATSLSDTSVTGQLSVDGSFILSNNGINVLGDTLSLQPLRQGNISFEGDKVVIDTEGNIAVEGNATFAQNVDVNGTLSARVISPIPQEELVIQLPGYDDSQGTLAVDRPGITVKNGTGSAVLKITDMGDIIASGAALAKEFQVVRGASADTSLSETVATASAGTAVIKANKYERTIVSPFVSANSLIYITAATDTNGVTPFIARQTAENPSTGVKGSFTIRIPVLQNKDIKVNWWIIN